MNLQKCFAQDIYPDGLKVYFAGVEALNGQVRSGLGIVEDVLPCVAP